MYTNPDPPADTIIPPLNDNYNSMKWIYGAIISAAGTVMKSYRVRPTDIMAVDLNNRQFYSNAIGWLYYSKEEEELILKLINSK